MSTAGGVKCWGLSTLSDGSTTNSAVPVDVVGLGSGVKAVSAGLGYTCAVTLAGAVKCWGDNTYGQLGNGTTTSSAVPVGVVGLGSGVVAVSAGEFHSCAVTSAGAVKCWGFNAVGELGDGTTAQSVAPVGVVGLGSGVVAVSASRSDSCAVTSLGAVKCWGYGDLGAGASTQSAVPVGVVGLGSGAVAVSAGGHHSCVRTSAGAVRCWGDNAQGELGVGATSESSVPVVVALG